MHTKYVSLLLIVLLVVVLVLSLLPAGSDSSNSHPNQTPRAVDPEPLSIGQVCKLHNTCNNRPAP